MTNSHKNAIFISYDGFGQSYLEALYLPILNSVKNPPVDFSVVQFIPEKHPQKQTERRAAEKLGINLHFINYHNSPPLIATLYLILSGLFKVGRLARKEKTDFIHARTIIPGVVALGAKLFRPKMKIIFDTDGFVPEYRVEIGVLKENGLIFKTLKKLEKLLVSKSDLILVRTESARELLIEWYGEEAARKIYVTPNGKDETFYQPLAAAENEKVRRKYNLSDDAIFIIYVGNLGELYLPDKMLRLFSLVKKRHENSFFLLLSSTEFEKIDDLARGEGLGESDYKVERVSPGEIPALISAADVGLAFRAPVLSMRGIAPLKVSEYLLCGTPAVINSSIGFLETLFEEKQNLGFLLKTTNDEELEKAADWIIETAKPLREQFRETARRGGVAEFGLSNIKKHYENVYSKLIN